MKVKEMRDFEKEIRDMSIEFNLILYFLVFFILLATGAVISSITPS